MAHNYPVVLIRADNTTANSWSNNLFFFSLASKAFMRLQCSMMINNPVGLNAEHVSGVDNDISDYISYFKKILTEFSPLNISNRYSQS